MRQKLLATASARAARPASPPDVEFKEVYLLGVIAENADFRPKCHRQNRENRQLKRVQTNSSHSHAQSRARSGADRHNSTRRGRISVRSGVRLIAYAAIDGDAEGVLCFGVSLCRELACGSDCLQSRIRRCHGVLDLDLRDPIAADAEIEPREFDLHLGKI